MKIPLLYGDKLFLKLAGAVNANEAEFFATSQEFSDQDPSVPPLPNRALGSSDGATKVYVFQGKQGRRLLIPTLNVRNADDQNITLTVGIESGGVDYELDSRVLVPGQVWTISLMLLLNHTHSLEQLVAGALSDGFNIGVGTGTGTKIGTAAAQKLGFFGATPVAQQLKANHNNWAALSDVIAALVNLGLIDQA